MMCQQPKGAGSPGGENQYVSSNVEGEFSREERTLLLKLAHDAIESALDGREVSLEPPSPHLAEFRGVFTTIYLGASLRGCVGHVFAVASLYQTVFETARASAFEDRRFPPVSLAEAAQLTVSLSILSPLETIRPEQIEVGRHGLLVSMAGHRGLLLPQVATEHEWDRLTFLQQTCRKAGLPSDAWTAGAQIEAFTAEVFGEDDEVNLSGQQL